MSRVADVLRDRLSAAVRALSSHRLLLALVVPAALALVLVCGLAPARSSAEKEAP